MNILGVCGKLFALLVVAIAVLIGWASQQEHPLGLVFKVPYLIAGLGKPGTEPVPDDMTPMPRPAGEILYDLPGGAKMPGNGLGTCCRPTAYNPVSVRRTVLWYLLQGGRHIDTAAVYLNHEAVGLGIKDAIERGVPRSEMFITTKMFFDNFGYQESIDEAHVMIKQLGVEYIDLVLLHTPVKLGAQVLFKYYTGSDKNMKIGDDPMQVKLRADTWRGLSEVRKKGLIKNLGVSNFNIKQLKEIQALNLAPIAANQMQYHPWVPNWMKEVVSFCHENKIIVTAYFSLGGHNHKTKAMDVETLNDIAKSHGRRPAQILLRWSLQKGASIIPGTGNHKHMAENLATYSFSLSDEDMQRLDNMSSHPISKGFTFPISEHGHKLDKEPQDLCPGLTEPGASYFGISDRLACDMI